MRVTPDQAPYSYSAICYFILRAERRASWPARAHRTWVKKATLLERESATNFFVEAGGGVYLVAVGRNSVNITRQTAAGQTLIVSTVASGSRATIVFDLDGFAAGQHRRILEDVEQACRLAAGRDLPRRQAIVCGEIARQARDMLDGS